ncbi:hypothetical protein P9112_000451 [Eukaryota sp. TZLM1-RC]
MQTVCHNMIQEYGHMIIEMLVDRFPPEVVCSSIGLCKEPIKQAADNDLGCTVCVWIVEWVENQIDESYTREQIKEVVLKVCDHVPHLMKAYCVDFIENYADVFIDYLLQSYTPDFICQKMSLCTVKFESRSLILLTFEWISNDLKNSGEKKNMTLNNDVAF